MTTKKKPFDIRLYWKTIAAGLGSLLMFGNTVVNGPPAPIAKVIFGALLALATTYGVFHVENKKS